MLTVALRVVMLAWTCQACGDTTFGPPSVIEEWARSHRRPRLASLWLRSPSGQVMEWAAA